MQYSVPSIPKVEFKELQGIIDSGWVSIGKYTKELEAIVAERFKVKHVIAVSCATTGLIIALKAAGIKNQRVAVPSFTWPSTVYALECNGNLPVFCDIKKDSWTIDVSDILGPHKSILPVDTFGADAGEFKDSIYDAAHAWDIPNLGHRGLAEVVSLSFTKVVTAQEGGLILTNNDEVAEICKELRRLSGRMTEINALTALKSIEFWDNEAYEMRKYIVSLYKNALDFEFSLQNTSYNHSVFSILLPTQSLRNKILKELSLQGIETKIYYEPIVDGLRVTEDIYSRSIALPVHPHMTKDDVHKISQISNKAVKMCPGREYLTRYFRRS